MMNRKNSLSSEQGISIVELLVVIILMATLVSFAMLGRASTKLFAADDQALIITDILQEARQKALTQGKILRVELNDTKKLIRLIDENNTTVAADDKVIRTSSYNPATSVGSKPANIDPVLSVFPKTLSPMPEIQYKKTAYPMSANDNVKTLRFNKIGEVLDDGTDGLGTGAVNSGTTIYVYNGASGSMSNVVRAITLSGITAGSQLLKCQTNQSGICVLWTK